MRTRTCTGIISTTAEFETTPKSGSVGGGSAGGGATRQRARVHWYVLAELFYVLHQGGFVAYFAARRAYAPMASTALPLLAVTALLCCYGGGAGGGGKGCCVYGGGGGDGEWEGDGPKRPPAGLDAYRAPLLPHPEELEAPSKKAGNDAGTGGV